MPDIAPLVPVVPGSCFSATRAARRTSDTASSTSKGLGRYSNAPDWYAVTALSRSEWAVITITGIETPNFSSRRVNSRPSIPGMRMSVIKTSGNSEALVINASSTLAGAAKPRTSIVSRCNAFSSTQRTESSSSTTHTLIFSLVFIMDVSTISRWLNNRQIHHEHCPAWSRFVFDQSLLPVNQILSQ